MSTPKDSTITASTIDINAVLLTAIIPEKWSCDGKPYEKTIKVAYDDPHRVELPIGTKVCLPGNNIQYTLVSEYMNDLPNPAPQDDLFIGLPATTCVIEPGGVPYRLGRETKVRLPDNCKFSIPAGTKLQGSNTLLVPQTRTTIELAPQIRPTATTQAPAKNAATPNPKDELLEEINKMIGDIKDPRLFAVVRPILLEITKQSILMWKS